MHAALLAAGLALAPPEQAIPDIVHTNAPFHDQDSDHDPQVVHLNLKR